MVVSDPSPEENVMYLHAYSYKVRASCVFGCQLEFSFCFLGVEYFGSLSIRTFRCALFERCPAASVLLTHGAVAFVLFSRGGFTGRCIL